MIKIPEKEGRLSAAKAAHIEAVIVFVKRKTERYRRDLFATYQPCHGLFQGPLRT